MKAATYNPEQSTTACLENKEVDKPTLTKNNAIVKIQAVGICGSDLLKLDRALIKPGTILGHEMVGIIEEISPEMQSLYGFKKADRIISSHHVPCVNCEFCARGKESLCKKFKTSNFNPGAFCEYLELSEDHLKHTVQKIPDSLTDLEASFTEPVACCIKAVKNSELQSTGHQYKVLVLGLGSIGLIIGQLVKHYYPKLELTGIDLNEERLKLAKDLGFDRTKKTSALDPSPSAQDDQQDDTYDYIFLCAGASASVDYAAQHANNGAVITVFSSTNQESFFANNLIYYKELTIKGSYSPNLDNLKEALKLINEKKIKVKELISHRTNLDNLGKTINQAKQEQGLKVLLEF